MSFCLPYLRLYRHLSAFTALCQRHFQLGQIHSLKVTPALPLVRTAATKAAKHEVIVSQSTCIFENLSLEEWLFENTDLENTSYLLIWRNTETVVIGRHQNAWIEANVPLLEQKGVSIARRNSGGGTVYHDLGNINFCFLTSRERYDRKWNLNLVTEAVNDQWMLNLSVNARDNIMWNDMFKVSGTAARLKSKRAYHHFTLLLDVNLNNLQSFLQSPLLGASSRATASIPSSVINLVDVEPQLTYDNVIQCVAQRFLSFNQNSQPTSIEFLDLKKDRSRFPGLDKILENRLDWKWIFGKTPTFTLDRHFITHCYQSRETCLRIHCKIQDGCINTLDIQLSPLDQKLDRLASSTKNALLTERLSGKHLQPVFERLRQNFSEVKEISPHLLDWFLNSLWVTFFG
ncbi:lipoyltransferase 1, mitochondrial isoform X1 [Octopus bimaculoides]|uniref:BPL/LPL catalytic domain-containing protein n=1 Tax=Octopus bimaculoides TaxID=37653 RepID=A0A0L8FIH2_OCTBM|nr:lipoyltransferase 1, mitochondrial isoform X1 [Octopus bimaculoides]XP_014789562.1 lipoyltransferase 1, mitochondrial isoform X1 [Octopus bimaculoides]|eukprot:XP_014789561.1 PREDICTED: lipoyltransferase 1, mitochondrial-like [Octopus bimaculoides]